MMKVSSSAIAASILAASTAALSSSSHSNSSTIQELGGRKVGKISLEKEKFAPRFDGLKFIETLVTAHR
ncbi:hypothetical protein SSX86_001472 [Deinandra increscens subsp. villosa]|uniref:Uncharacterized protein n=1 Tax=Deinandra increscens subsp. villosa TaxID=3103831 RepID=A0AAP0HAU7_9ASTR